MGGVDFVLMSASAKAKVVVVEDDVDNVDNVDDEGLVIVEDVE